MFFLRRGILSQFSCLLSSTVEHAAVNRGVAGSKPAGGAKGPLLLYWFLSRGVRLLKTHINGKMIPCTGLLYSGVEHLAARQCHKLKVIGSSPISATRVVSLTEYSGENPPGRYSFRADRAVKVVCLVDILPGDVPKRLKGLPC